jgi:hypothetical protein
MPSKTCGQSTLPVLAWALRDFTLAFLQLLIPTIDALIIHFNVERLKAESEAVI